MLFFGIDPGSVYTGFGVVECCGSAIRFVDGGRISVGRDAFSERLLRIYTALTQLMRTHIPNFVSLEEVFVAKNPGSALKLGQARGVCLLAASQSGAKVCEFSTRFVKKAITGSGRADKAQMQYMVSKLLRLQHRPSEDEADALALAFTLASRYAQAQSMQKSVV